MNIKQKGLEIWAWIKGHKKRSILIALFVFLVVFAFSGGKENGKGEGTVTRETLVQEVVVTGKTVAVQDVSLGFDRGGRVGSSPFVVGNRVEEGQIIASLSAQDLSANRAKAQADLNEALVRLEQISRTSQSSNAEARATMVATIKSSFADADDAIRNKIDQFYRNPRQSSTYIEFAFKDGNTEYKFPIPFDQRISLNTERYAIESVLNEWNARIKTIDSATDLGPYIVEAEQNLLRIKAFLDDVAFAANSIESVEYQYESTINGYKTTVAIARTNVNTSYANFITKKDRYNAAPTNVSGTGVLDEVALQEARVQSARAALSLADAELQKTIIRAPFDGVITKQDAKVGETVTAGNSVISIISDKNLEIEANVSEVNVGKINPENTVSITFDAYPGKKYTGKVVYIEPAETLIDNVVYYKIKVSLEGDVSELKTGLTANLRIETATKENVLTVPLFSIIEEEGVTYVERKKDNDSVERVEVKTGLVGNTSRVEIEGAVNEGDIVVVTLVE